MGPDISGSVGASFCSHPTPRHTQAPWCRPVRPLWTGVALCCPLVAIVIMVPASVDSSAWGPLAPAQVGGTSRMLGAALPTPGLEFLPPYRPW